MNALLRCQRLLVGHGARVLLAGFAIGFGFLFFLVGEISLWPIPGKIDYQLPGSYDAWRMAHMEGVINGLALWLLALVLPVVPISEALCRRLTWAMILAAWTIVSASALDPLFPQARGLSMGGSVPNTIAFLLFYVGIVAAIWLGATIAVKALAGAREAGR